MSSSNSDEDSFSKVGYSDAESLCGGAVNDDEKDEAKGKKIEVQLPPHFSTGNKAGGINESVASEASSFIPVTYFGKMKVAEGGPSVATVAAKTAEKTGSENVDEFATTIKKSIAELAEDAKLALDFLEQQGKAKENHLLKMKGIPNTIGNISLHPPREKDDSSVGWSVVSSAAAYPKSTSGDDDDNSIAAGSTISGFDMISLGGTTKKQCKRCSFLNKRCDNICKGCDAALVANPMLSADEQLARHLQQQEEQEAFKDIVCEERKRTSLGKQPLLFRAQTLADDIVAVAESYQMPHNHKKVEGEKKASMRFQTLPAASLAILASRFIDYFDELSPPKKIDVCFCYTDDKPGRMTQIRQDGFGPNSKFGSDAEGAFEAFKRKHRTRYLATVIESEPDDQRVNDEGPTIITSPPKAESWVPPNTKGWIAVVVQQERNEKHNSSFPSKAKSAHSWIYSRTKSLESLPLVLFDAKLIHDGAVAGLVKGLHRALTDFFEPYTTDSISDSDNAAKRRKMEDEDLALAQALHASLNGHFAEASPPEPRPLDAGSGGNNTGTLFPETLELLRGEPIDTTKGLSVTPEEEKDFNSLIDAVLGPDEAVSGEANENQSVAQKVDEELAAVEFGTEGGQDGMVRVAALADDVVARNLEAAAASLEAQTTDKVETVREEDETEPIDPIAWRPGPGESWMEPIDAKSSSN